MVDKAFPVIMCPRQSNCRGGYFKGCIVCHSFEQNGQDGKITCSFYVIALNDRPVLYWPQYRGQGHLMEVTD